jgi:polysaccharide export outer membrane protein
MTSLLLSSHQGARCRRIARACALLLIFACAAFSAQAQFNGPALGAGADINRPVNLTTDPGILFPAPRDLRIGPGDDLVVRIFGSPEYNPQVRVSLDGSVQIPLAGLVPVAGLTLHEAETRIAQNLIAAGMYQNPQVTLQMTASPNQIATVTGELHAVVPLTGQRRLLDVLAAAGGLPSTASHTLTINRKGLDKPIVVDLSTNPERSEMANIPIFAGDTIVVSKIGVVYMLGAFKIQGQIPLQQNAPLTLLQATSLAGGPGFEGKFADLRIIRTVGSRREMVRVDVKKVREGKAPDPILQADDIVLLPTDLLKSMIKSGGISIALTIGSLLIYLTHY